MEAFIQEFGPVVTEVVKEVRPTATPEEINAFLTVCAFLDEHPNPITDKAKAKGKQTPKSDDKKHLTKIAQKFFNSRDNKKCIAEPKTIPDPAVSVVMENWYGYSTPESEQIAKEHQRSMSSENIIGDLLERYMATEMEAHGWVWCAGGITSAVDFIKWADGAWLALQVKNRKTTENSSSNKIRADRNIQTWFRSFPDKNTQNWKDFSRIVSEHSLNEDGFRTYITEYLRAAKTIKELE